MQKALTEALKLRRPGLASGHLGEVGVHAAVPAAEAAYLFAGVKFLDVVALTGRADEGAGAAAKAALAELLPLRTVEERLGLSCAEAFEGQTVQGEFFHDLPRARLKRGDSVRAAVCQKRKTGRQCFALLRVGAPVERGFIHPAGHVPGGVSRVNAEGGAEAGFLRTGAGERHDGDVFAPRLIEGVGRGGEEHPVENIEAAAVAGAHAKEHKGRDLGAVLDQLQIFALHAEINEIFHLREEQILRAANGVQALRERNALLPAGVIGLTRGVVRGEIELLPGGDRREELVQARKRKLFHSSAPPLR